MVEGHAWQGGGHAWQGGMHGRGMCMAGGCAWQGGMHGRGYASWGACVARGGGHAWHTANELAVRILLECILVSVVFKCSFYYSAFDFIALARLVYV